MLNLRTAGTCRVTLSVETQCWVTQLEQGVWSLQRQSSQSHSTETRAGHDLYLTKAMLQVPWRAQSRRC